MDGGAVGDMGEKLGTWGRMRGNWGEIGEMGRKRKGLGGPLEDPWRFGIDVLTGEKLGKGGKLGKLEESNESWGKIGGRRAKGGK